MIITLIVLLTIMEVALWVSSVGLELSYQVGKRANSIRSATGKLAVKATKRTKVKKPVKYLTKGADIVGNTATTALGVVAKVGKPAIKATIKLLKLVVSLLRKLLTIIATTVLIIDIIVFFMLVAIAFVYVSVMGS